MLNVAVRLTTIFETSGALKLAEFGWPARTPSASKALQSSRSSVACQNTAPAAGHLQKCLCIRGCSRQGAQLHTKTLRPGLVTPDAPEIFASQTALAEEFNLLPASFLERLGSPRGRQSLEGGGGGAPIGTFSGDSPWRRRRRGPLGTLSGATGGAEAGGGGVSGHRPKALVHPKTFRP